MKRATFLLPSNSGASRAPKRVHLCEACGGILRWLEFAPYRRGAG